MLRLRPMLLLAGLALAGAACAEGDQSPSPRGIESPAQPPAATAPGSPAATTPAESPAATGPAGSPALSPGASPAGETINVIGVDYAFQQMPSSVPGGTVLAFENQGTELHEMGVLGKNDGVELTFEELLALPQEEALTMVTFVGHTIAAPGESAEQPVPVTQEGEYMLICFIPQGTFELPPGGVPGESPAVSPGHEMPTASPGGSPTALGPPHFVLGMLQQFQVTEAGTTPGPVPTPAGTPGGSPAGSPTPASP